MPPLFLFETSRSLSTNASSWHSASNALAFTHNKIVAKMLPCRKYARAIKSLGQRGKNGKKDQGRKT
jgi:hypothetical protein